MANERIHIKVTQDGAKAVRKDVEGLGAGADKASAGMGRLATMVKGFVAAAAVRETIKLADAYTDLTNKIRFSTNSEREMISVREELFRVANQNRSSIETTADVYGKLRLSTQALGLSQNEVIELTDTLQKATALSGASAENAANSLRQLGQGMAAGALRGDELNSVLENTPYIAQVIAESLGKDIGAIRKMGAEGKITGKIIADAFKGAREEVVERFGERVPKVSEAMTVAMNVATRLVGEIDSTTGASGALAQGIIDVSNALNEAIPQIAELAAELGDISELKGALDELLPDLDGDGISALQFMALMFSTIEDRIIGVARAASKMWAALSFGMEDMPAGSLLQDLGDIATGQGDVTARVMARIQEQRGGRRGTTTVNADPNDPGNTMDRKGPNTTVGADAKGKSFREIISLLERENSLLQMSNDERAITEAYIKAFEDSEGNLTRSQLDQVEVQLRKNQSIAIEKRLLDEVEERLEKQLEIELEAMKVEEETQKTYEEMLRGLVIEQELWHLTNSEREIAAGLMDAQAQAQGRLNDEQLRTLEIEMRKVQRLNPSEMPEDFAGAQDFMGQQFLDDMRTFGQEMAIIFGPGGLLHQGLQNVVGSMSDVIAHSIVFGQSWNDTAEAIKGIGRMILQEILSSLIRIPIQMAINETIASTLRAKATAETVAQQGTIAAASIPAATGVSLATAGTNGIGASAAIIGVAALAAGVLAGAALFEDGGYTGNGATSGVAGLVHGKEFVLHADATSRYRREAEAMNAGTYKPGGGGTQVQVSILNQAPGVEFETRRVDDQHIEIVARRVANEVAADAVARDLRSPQSKVGRAITSTTTAKRSIG
jgi:tape measure domain-containing protein